MMVVISLIWFWSYLRRCHDQRKLKSKATKRCQRPRNQAIYTGLVHRWLADWSSWIHQTMNSNRIFPLASAQRLIWQSLINGVISTISRVPRCCARRHLHSARSIALSRHCYRLFVYLRNHYNHHHLSNVCSEGESVMIYVVETVVSLVDEYLVVDQLDIRCRSQHRTWRNCARVLSWYWRGLAGRRSFWFPRHG